MAMAKRREFSAKIRLAAFERANGHCEGCGCRLTPGRFAYDHRIPDAMGGEPTLDNCQVLCSGCHGVKTAKGDVPTIAKSVRIRKRAAGIRNAPLDYRLAEIQWRDRQGREGSMKPTRRRKERQPYAFVRRGNALWPDMEMDLRALDGVPQNGIVHIDIRNPRNPARLRAYWAMLNEVVEATDCTPTPEQLHEIIKLELQFVDLIRLPNGVTIALPGSVAFEAMAEHEFINFFQRAEEWLARTYGYVKEQAA